MALGRKFASLAALHPTSQWFPSANVSRCFRTGRASSGSDRTQIAFVTDRSYVHQCCVEVWIMGSDGSNLTQVTSSLGKCPERRLGDCGYPDWGPASV